MRPLRGLIVCLGTLVLVTVLLTLRRSGHEYSGPAAARTSRSRLRALFSFHTPESLFPPSAIISLTDDNSTFFLARPAAYGASLPSDGLSGQLWVGSGFGEGDAAINAEGELGCSDIPAWPYTGDSSITTDNKENQKGKKGTSHRNPKEAAKKPARALDSNQQTKSTGKSPSAPSLSDGTDDYLHWPLKGAPLIRGASVPEKSQDGGGKDSKDKEHADIQSIQESAEIAGKVVLLSRGGCGFLEKTKWVQRRGGVALIVGDNARGANLITMYANGDTSNVTIPSIFTSHMSAQLLSSLTPNGGLLRGRPISDDLRPASGGRKSSKQPAKTDEKPAAPADAKAATTTTTRPNGSQNTGPSLSWLNKLVGALGLGGDGVSAGDRRFPNSGRISWVQSHDWDEESQSKQTQDTKQQQQQPQEEEAKSGSNVVTKPKGSGSDGFVIGVHDWRDPDLVALQKEANQGTLTKTSTKGVRTPTPTAVETKTKGFSGGNALPGSGRYSIPMQGGGGDQGKNSDKDEEPQADPEKSGWLGKIFGSDVEELTEEEALGLDAAESAARFNPPLSPPLIDTPGPREGLWVTITPTTMSSSPFFDTLLVLVVSPLITLTVVYALLLLRARIQRRRWRAPKSVVDRLPVRIYHTMSASSTSSSSHTPSVDASSATSPLLQSDQTSTLSRTRPRSRTTTSINESAALTLERQREDLASRLEKKRYRGRQIECAVCLEEYVDGQSQVMSLPCGHEFHAECITPWLTTRRRTCPICKGDVVRSLAAGSSAANRSVSSSPDRVPRVASRTHSLDRSSTPHSDTPLLGRQGDDDLERGRGGRPVRSSWDTITGTLSRIWDRRRSEDTVVDRDR